MTDYKYKEGTLMHKLECGRVDLKNDNIFSLEEFNLASELRKKYKVKTWFGSWGHGISLTIDDYNNYSYELYSAYEGEACRTVYRDKYELSFRKKFGKDRHETLKIVLPRKIIKDKEREGKCWYAYKTDITKLNDIIAEYHKLGYEAFREKYKARAKAELWVWYCSYDEEGNRTADNDAGYLDNLYETDKDELIKIVQEFSESNRTHYLKHLKAKRKGEQIDLPTAL